MLIGDNALILCLILLWIIPGIDVQGPWTPPHWYLRIPCHIKILPVTPPGETLCETKRKNQCVAHTDVCFNYPVQLQCCSCSYMGWGFPFASHSMTIVSLGSTICSFIDCFMMVGGCRTAGVKKIRLVISKLSQAITSQFSQLGKSPSRGMSNVQTLCHKISSSTGLTGIPIFTFQWILQYCSPVLLLLSQIEKIKDILKQLYLTV